MLRVYAPVVFTLPV